MDNAESGDTTSNPLLLAVQARQEDKVAAERLAEKLRTEQADLVKRILDLQSSHHERMNEVAPTVD